MDFPLLYMIELIRINKNLKKEKKILTRIMVENKRSHLVGMGSSSVHFGLELGYPVHGDDLFKEIQRSQRCHMSYLLKK
jgi:hypothetical protein